MDILLVDDNILMQQVISRFLTSLGHSVSATDSAEGAVALAQAQRFELLLLDLRLPDADGEEALETLRGLPGYNTVPAIAISGFGDEQARWARSAGFDGFLAKPIEFGQLQSLVEHYQNRERVVSH